MANEPPNEFGVEPFDTPAIYELRVEGRLDQALTAWFEDVTLKVDERTSPPQTVIRGQMRDQAALYGLIGRLRDLGLTLLSIRRLEEED